MEQPQVPHSTTGVSDQKEGAPRNPSLLSQPTQSNFRAESGPSRQSSYAPEPASDPTMRRSESMVSQSQTLTPSRGGTLRKKSSVKRVASLNRSASRKSLAGSVKNLALADGENYDGPDIYSALFTPVPTRGNPTEILANRFQDWRKVLKDIIAYFREVQKTHEARSKSLLSLSNIVSNINGPHGFLPQGGLSEATNILHHYHKQSLAESNKAKHIEDEIMAQLTGLRSDLSQKIKEIKNLSGDFKNSVDKETDNTRRAIRAYQEAVELVEKDPSAITGKGDPYIVKMSVERAIERQIDEENYLHRVCENHCFILILHLLTPI